MPQLTFAGATDRVRTHEDRLARHTSRAAATRTVTPVAVHTRVVAGQARLGRRTKELVKRLTPADIAVVAHRDLDRVSGEDLIAAGVAAVINTQPCSTGAYPNMGPLLLARAGVHLVETLEDDLFEQLQDGDAIELRDGEIRRAGRLIATGRVLDPAELAARHEALRADVGAALEAFARNTVERMVEERELLTGRLELPPLRTDLRDRPVLVVVRGAGHQRDLRALRPYVRDVRPVIVAVDGGADAVLDEGLWPDMIVGDMDSASERALRCGAELVVHAYPGGDAPGRARLDALGLQHALVPAPGTSQDVAMLIAHERGAQLIVSVGSQFNLVEFLDKSRSGMSSTFLTRLRIGERLVDAKGVSRLYRPRPGLGPVLALAAAGAVALAATVLATPGLRAVAALVLAQAPRAGRDLTWSTSATTPSRSWPSSWRSASASCSASRSGTAAWRRAPATRCATASRATSSGSARTPARSRRRSSGATGSSGGRTRGWSPAACGPRASALVFLGRRDGAVHDQVRAAIEPAGGELAFVADAHGDTEAQGRRAAQAIARGGTADPDLLSGIAGSLGGADAIVVARTESEGEAFDARLRGRAARLRRAPRGRRARHAPAGGWYRAHDLTAVDNLDDPVGMTALVLVLAGDTRGADALAEE